MNKREKMELKCVCGQRRGAGEHGSCPRLAQGQDCLSHHQFIPSHRQRATVIMRQVDPDMESDR